MTTFRFWLFKQLSRIVWRICPEPHRSRLKAVMPRWGDERVVKIMLDAKP